MQITRSTWIFSHFYLDFLSLWAGAFLIIFLFQSLEITQASPLTVFLAYIFIDSGHAYVTLLRTYFNKDEFNSSNRYIKMPILFFILIFFWAYFGVPYLWSFIVYSTFYHNTRQYYGIYSWYGRLNQNTSPFFKLSLYTLTTLPFMSFHFRELTFQNIYSQYEFFFYPNAKIFLSLFNLNLILIILFLIASIYLFFKKKGLLPTSLSILFPSTLNFYCFSVADTTDKILIPLLVIHGVAYFFLTNKVLKKETPYFKKSFLQTFGIILSVAFFLGLSEKTLAHYLVDFTNSQNYRFNFTMSASVSLIILPSLCHYWFDAQIWKGTNKSFKKVFL